MLSSNSKSDADTKVSATAIGSLRPASIAAARRSSLWERLSEMDTQRTLALLGAGVVVIVAVVWTTRVRFLEKLPASTSTVTATHGEVAAGGNVTAIASAEANPALSAVRR